MAGVCGSVEKMDSSCRQSRKVNPAGIVPCFGDEGNERWLPPHHFADSCQEEHHSRCSTRASDRFIDRFFDLIWGRKSPESLRIDA